MMPDCALPNSAELAPVVTEASSNELVAMPIELPPPLPMPRLPGVTGTPSTYVAASSSRPPRIDRVLPLVLATTPGWSVRTCAMRSTGSLSVKLPSTRCFEVTSSRGTSGCVDWTAISWTSTVVACSAKSCVMV